MSAARSPDGSSPRLETLKALGDNTRYAIYLELARSPAPLSTAEIASTLGLHVNTVRPHLERMRDVGLLDVAVEARRGVGRPQHLYSLSPSSPSLGLEPPAFPLLAALLACVSELAGARRDDALEVGREQGLVEGRRRTGRLDCVSALVEWQAEQGFDPERVDGEEECTVAFGHCPYGELARQHSELICALHSGLIEGLVEAVGGAEVTEFRSVADRRPCQVELVVV